VQPNASPEKKGGKRKAKKSPNSQSKRAKGTTFSPTAAMLPLINGELRQYQLKGITWLISLWTNGQYPFLSHLAIHCMMNLMNLSSTEEQHRIAKGLTGQRYLPWLCSNQ
jgi:SNF2 family DNA or RNA helicase